MPHRLKGDRAFILMSLSVALIGCYPNSSEHIEQSQATSHSVHTSTVNAVTEQGPVATSQATEQPRYIMEYMQSMKAMTHQMDIASQWLNPDIAFVKGMVAHHQGAIEMANIHLKYGKDNQIRALAQHIIDTQQHEINFMNDWLNQPKHHKAALDSTGASMHHSGTMHAHDDMKQALLVHDADIAFVKSMIIHHQGAIDMAQMELKTGEDKQLQQLAKRIIATQQQEIAQMQAWLAAKR